MADWANTETSNLISGGSQYGAVLQGRDFDVTVQSAVTPPKSLAQLPPRVTGFAGRDRELQTIIGFLDPASGANTVLVSAVAGLAGVGKTALAVAAGYAVQERGWYSGGVLFINLHGYDDSALESSHALDSLLRALGVPSEYIPPGTEARSALYRSVLAQTKEPVLVIADNAFSETQVQPLLPGAGPHRLLVTSRHTLAGLDARLLDVQTLTDAAGVELLDAALRAARPDDDRIGTSQTTATRLVRLCGGLPLALKIVAALLKADISQTIIEMEGELTAQQDRLEQLRYDDGSGMGTLSVARAFSLSYKKLGEQSARMFCFIPINPGPDVSTTALAIIADLPRRRVRQILGELARAHLVEVAPGSNGRWRMHDLLHLYAKQLGDSTGTDELERARDRLNTHYIALTKAAVFKLLAPPMVVTSDSFRDREAAMIWLETERLNVVAAACAAHQCGESRLAFDLSVNIVEYLSWRHYLEEWTSAASVGLDAARSLGDRDKEAGALSNLGLAFQAANRLDEAVAAHRCAADIFRELNDEHRFGMAIHNLGMALKELDRFDEALKAYHQDLLICRKTGDRLGESVTLCNLMNCLSKMKRIKEAIDAGNQAVAICRDIGDKRSEAVALNGLCGCLAEVGDITAAVEVGNRSLALFHEVSDHYQEAKAHVNLGAVLYEANRYDESVNIGEKAAAISRGIGDRGGEGRALTNVAGSLLQLGRATEAIDADRRAVELFRDVGNRNHEGTALNNLGSTLMMSDSLDEAIDAHKAAAAIFLDIEEKEQAGDALNNLAVDFGKADRFMESIAASQESIVIFRETRNRSGEANALQNIGKCNQHIGNNNEAIKNYQEAVKIYKNLGDRRHESSLLPNLAFLLAVVNRISESISACKRTVAIYRQDGDTHSEGIALNNLAIAMRTAERFEESIAAGRSALILLRGACDRENEVRTLVNLAAALRATGNVEEAEEVEQEAITISGEVDVVGLSAETHASHRDAGEAVGISTNALKAANPGVRRRQPRRQTRQQRNRQNKGTKH